MTTIAGTSFTVGENRSVGVASHITLANLTGDNITEYAFWDAGGGSGGYFTVNGARQAADQWIEVNPLSLVGVDYVGGSTTGSQTLSIDAYDATTGKWIPYSSFTATTIVPVGPTVAAQNFTVA